jgi:hypothetical protein
MTEKHGVPEEVFEALIRLNIGSYAWQTMKSMHGLMVNFAKGMEVAYIMKELPPNELVTDTFNGLLAGANHIKEMLKLFGEPDDEVMQKYKESLGVESWSIHEHPETEQGVYDDDRIQRLGILVNETVEDVKLRLGGEELAQEFAKILKEALAQEQDSNDSPTD